MPALLISFALKLQQKAALVYGAAEKPKASGKITINMGIIDSLSIWLLGIPDRQIQKVIGFYKRTAPAGKQKGTILYGQKRFWTNIIKCKE